MKEILDEDIIERTRESKGLVYFKFFMIFWYGSIILITIGNWTGQIRFGWGLGDGFYFIGIIITLMTVVFVHFSLWSNKLLRKRYSVFAFLCFLILFYLILQMTIFRGSESSWNGQIFF